MSEVGRIPRGPRALLGTALVALATCTSVLALNGLIQHGRWLGVTWLTVLVVAGVVAGVRAVARSWWMPSLVGLLVAFSVLLVRYGAPPGRIQVVPDLGALHRTLATAREGVDIINASLVPMPGVRSAELLVVTGALAVFLLADALAIGLGVPALSGLAFATLWVPAIVLGFPASGWPLALTAVCYLLLLALSVIPTSATADRTRRASVAVAGAIGLVVVTLVAGPAVAAFPGWASVALPDLGQGPVGPMRLSDNLDLRESLGKRSQQAVLTYTVKGSGDSPGAATTSPSPAATGSAASPSPSASATAPAAPVATAHTIGPLRAFTLTDFDGRSWDSSAAGEGASQDVASGAILSPDVAIDGKAPDASRGTLADVSLQIKDLRDRHLPISTFSRALDVRGSWSYAPSSDTVTGSRTTTDGMKYAMVVEIPTLTADDLRSAEPGDPGDGGATLAVPKTDHSRDIAQRAHEIAAGAKTPYDQALALQQYFRSAQNFTYDTRVAPARTDDAVWDFLQNKHGYCVQFATSMVVMARDLGIPARLGVGFLPGDATGDDSGSYTITGHDSHAWPELYFEGYGWVRFEPTPAVQTGAPPVWSDPLANQGSSTSHPEALEPTGASTAAPGTRATSAPTTTIAQQGGTPWLAVLVTTAIVLLIAALVGVPLVRRRLTRGPALTPEGAWAKARRRLAGAGITWADTDTPRTASAAVRSQVQDRSGAPLAESADVALRGLAATVERMRYAPTEPEVDPVLLESWVEELATGVSEAVSDRTRRGAVPSGPRAGS